MIATLLHAETFIGIPRWTCAKHFGSCGMLCGCCRAAMQEGFGACLVCAYYTPKCETIFRNIFAYMSEEPKPELISLRSLCRTAIQKEISMRIASFVPMAASWSTSMRSGTVVAKVILTLMYQLEADFH